MSTTHKHQPDFPTAKVKRQAKLSLIWLVPIIAALVAGVLVFQQLRKIGPTITIQFKDGNGLQANQSVLRYRGVQVGSVRAVQLTKDAKNVQVVARLDRSAATLAREGTIFWIVRPEVGAGGLHGLETIMSGVYIQALPAKEDARPARNFTGVEEAPIVPSTTGGVEFVLRTPSNASLNEGSPVYYRGMEVGSVNYLVLTSDATAVEVHVLVKTNFAPLVRNNTVWWNAGGLRVNLHFIGIEVSAENFKSLLVGGVAFATPTNFSAVASNGTVFPLHDKSEEKWLKWTPAISITNANAIRQNESVPSIDLSQPQSK